MIDNRKTRAKKNIVTSLCSQVVVLLCGIIVPWLIISKFGSEAYGATASITQFLAYITLLEGGIGGVARAVLYKPLANKDMETISAIMGEIKKFFVVVAWIFAVYVVVLACGFHSLSHVEGMDWITSCVLVIVISISTFGQYFIGISNTILLQSDQKSYITNLVSIVATVINALSVLVLVSLNCSLIIVKLVSSCIFFMRPVALWLYVKKYYPIRKQPAVKGTVFLQQKWTGLGQHIAFFLHANTGIAVLTVLTDLRTVAVYSVYNMVVGNIQNFATSFVSGMEALFGDMLAREESEKLQKTFGLYETILSVVSVILFCVTAVLIVPFVRIYTAGVNDTNYIQPLFAILMILAAMTYCLRLPYHAMVIAAGHFKQTSLAAYGEAVINIGLSVALVSQFGLIGVAIATLAATWFRFVYYVLYLSRNIFYRKNHLFAKRFMVNAAIAGVNFVLGSGIVSAFTIEGYLSWALCGALLVAVMSVVTLLGNLCFFRTDCMEILRKYRK